MVGQDGVWKTLKNAIRRERVAHAYLFSGSRGTGKTSMARILAKALNCPNTADGEPCNECDMCATIAAGSDVDVIEIDGASNNKVEEVRVLRDNVRYVPQRAKYKIYIIDEVHMLSKSAFNALLKTLEEPPAHVKFIFATTEPHMLPETIHSRCQRFDFNRIQPKAIAGRLALIAEKEGIKTAKGVFEKIASSTRGGMRDAISLLDQLTAYCEGEEVTPEEVDDLLGRVGTKEIARLFAAIAAHKAPEMLDVIENVASGGRALAVFIEEIIAFARNLMVLKICGTKSPILEAIHSELGLYEPLTDSFSEDTLLYIIETLSAVKQKMRWSTEKRTPLEAALIKLTHMDDLASVGELIARIERLEDAYSNAAPPPSAGARGVKKNEPMKPPDKAPPPAAPCRLEDVQTWWGRLQELVTRKRPQLTAYIRASRPGTLEGGKLIIEVSTSVQMDALSGSESRRAIQSAIAELTGSEAGVVVRLVKEQREESKIREHPVAKKLIEDFKGRIVENQT
jgi:DNA polymerase-3 subunit gamma/tau